MVNIHQLKSISPPAMAALRETEPRFLHELEGREAEVTGEWHQNPYPSTYWSWWDDAVTIAAVDAWVKKERHGDAERLVGRWLLASPGSAYDRLAARPNPDAYAVSMLRVLRILERWPGRMLLSDLEIRVNLYDQWGKTRARRNEHWIKLISRAHRLAEVRRQLCVWARLGENVEVPEI